MEAEDFAGEEDGEAALVGRRAWRRQGEDAVELEALAFDRDDGGAEAVGAGGAQGEQQVLGAFIGPVGADRALPTSCPGRCPVL